MHSVTFIQDFTIVIVIAGLVTVIFRKLKQPVVLGYILAGFIIGPHSPPFSLIHDPEIIKTLAQLGVIFLMFSLGLHFSLRKLKKVGLTALIASALEIVLMLFIGFEVGQIFGWSDMDSLFLGAILSISSTTIIFKALAELKKDKEPFAQLIFGILIVEDILGIALLALLSSIALTGQLHTGQVLDTLGRLGIFLAVALVLGLMIVPGLIRYVAKFNSREMMLITVLGLCFGLSLVAIKLGYSEAIGAFLAGALLAETPEHEAIDRLVEPVRDLFSAIFFVSVGLLIDPSLLTQYTKPIAVIVMVVVVGKVFSCSLGSFVGGNDTKTSLKVGMSVAQIGEFSFIIAALGLTLGVTSAFLYPIAVMVSVFTTLLTPYLIRASDPIVRLFDRWAPRGVVAWLELYPRWIQGLRQRETTVFRKQLRRALLIILLNSMMISAIFIGADYIADHLKGWWSESQNLSLQPESVSWFAAMLLSLPFLVATFRKLHALGMMVAETGIPAEGEPSTKVKVLRVILSNTIVLVGVLGLSVWILYLSSTLYPPRSALIGMLIVLGLVLVIFWRLFIRLYSKFQGTLEESLKEG